MQKTVGFLICIMFVCWGGIILKSPHFPPPPTPPPSIQQLEDHNFKIDQSIADINEKLDKVISILNRIDKSDAINRSAYAKK